MYSSKPLISLKHYTRTETQKEIGIVSPLLDTCVRSICKYILVPIQLQLAAGVGSVCKYIIVQIQKLPGSDASMYAKTFSLSALLFGPMHWFKRCVS